MDHFILCHKVGKLTGCDFCGFTFYFDNHLRFFDYSRVNMSVIFSLSFFLIFLSLSFLKTTFDHSRVNKFIIFCRMSILQPLLCISIVVAYAMFLLSLTPDVSFIQRITLTQTIYHSCADMKTRSFNSVISSCL